jgi:NADH-quinone oxidoreductase subunit N
MALLMFGVFRKDQSADLVNAASVVVLALTGALVIFGSEGRELAFHGAFVVDGFARLFKILVLLGSAARSPCRCTS